MRISVLVAAAATGGGETMRARTRLLIVVLLAGSSAALFAAKPAPAPDPDWKCSIELRNRSGDAITSDGGAYVHGKDGVQCTIVRGRDSHFNWLYVQFADTSPRSMMFLGQSQGSASYLSFANKGTFEVEGMADIAWAGTPYTDVRPFRGIVRSPQFARGVGGSTATATSPAARTYPTARRMSGPLRCSCRHSISARGRSRPTRPRIRR